jgi:hypothetical protein
MTVPVLTFVQPPAGPFCKTRFTVAFMAPHAVVAAGGPPAPTDASVFVKTTGAAEFYVASKGGWVMTDGAEAGMAAGLASTLEAAGVAVADRVFLAGYMVAYRPVNVFEEMGKLESELLQAAVPLLETFESILEAIVARIPAPKGRPAGPLRAMIIDSWFDNYVGVVMLVRVVDGRLAKGERIKLMATGATYNADGLGVFTPANEPRQSLEAGEVGYVIAGIREREAAANADDHAGARGCRPNAAAAFSDADVRIVEPDVSA